MSEWLFLGTDRHDSFKKHVLGKKPETLCLGGIPTSKDLESKVFVIDTFPLGGLKKDALNAISGSGEWKGLVASLVPGGSATLLGTTSRLGDKLVCFDTYPHNEVPYALELYRNEMTDDEAIQTVRAAFEELECRVFVCRDQAGGIFPRVLASMINEAARMAYGGIAPVEKIDKMMKLAANFPMGPFEWADKIGLDAVLATLEDMHREFGPKYQPCPLIRRKVEAGTLGVKTGEGFYNYSIGGEE